MGEASRKYKRDLRMPVAIFLAVLGLAAVLLTKWLNGDTWSEFAAIAGYSVGWAALTFGVLYLLTKKFEDWEWGREDHDLVAFYDKVVRDDREEEQVGT